MLTTLSAVAEHTLGGLAAFRPWLPLGDWSPMVITNSVAYALGACLSFAALLAERAASQRGVRGDRPSVWGLCGVLLIVLLLVERLDLLFLVTEAFRHVFRDVGYYARRRVLQDILLAIVAILALGLMVRAGRKLQLSVWRYRVALLALCALGLLMIVRVISLHQMDVLMGTELLPHVKVFGLLEFLGISGVALPAGWALVKAMLSADPG